VETFSSIMLDHQDNFQVAKVLKPVCSQQLDIIQIQRRRLADSICRAASSGDLERELVAGSGSMDIMRQNPSPQLTSGIRQLAKDRSLCRLRAEP
jgi:hypothetical protein